MHGLCSVRIQFVSPLHQDIVKKFVPLYVVQISTVQVCHMLTYTTVKIAGNAGDHEFVTNVGIT